VSVLGRVLDPEAIHAMTGPSGRLELRVSPGWGGRMVEVVAPARVACSRCDGGGCDACNRSGAIKLDPSPARRTLTVCLPRDLSGGVALRIVHPFGEGGALEVLVLEVRPSDVPDSNVTPISPRGLRFRAAYVPTAVAIALAAIALVLAFSSR
jgi:hypothetical protein